MEIETIESKKKGLIAAMQQRANHLAQGDPIYQNLLGQMKILDELTAETVKDKKNVPEVKDK